MLRFDSRLPGTAQDIRVIMEVVLSYIGLFLLAKCGFNFIMFWWRMARLYLLPHLGFRRNLKKYGSWAVVTGATDGIGKAIAKELAKRGINIVLISRTEDKLEKVAVEIGGNVEIQTIQYDFTDPDSYEKISDQLKDLDIGILVNNVGMGTGLELYLDQDEKKCDDMINVNMVSVLKMTRVVLDQMVKRKKGLLVHISSLSSRLPCPFLLAYGSSKSFVNNFSESLHHEYFGKGIHNQVVTPSFVSTNMSGNVKANGFGIVHVSQMAKQTVNAMGLCTKMCGTWSHELQAACYLLLPKWFLVKKIVAILSGKRKRT